MSGRRPQLSVAVAAPVVAVLVEAPHCRSTLTGQVITGAVVSTKLICCVQLLALPQPSVAVQMRSTPVWWVQLAGVVLSLKVRAGLPPQLSVAVAAPVV